MADDYPGLLKRGRRWCYDIQVRGERHQGSLNTTNKEVARERYRQRRAEIELGLTRKPLTEWLDQYCRAMRAKSRTHKDEVERINRLFCQDSGASSPADLDGSKAEAWLLGYGETYGRRGEVSARTLAKYAQHLSQFGAYLVKHRRSSGLRENPFDALDFTWSDDDRVYRRRHAKAEELMKLLAVCPTYRGVVYMTAAFTGLRRNELALRVWEEVNLDHPTPEGLGWVHLSATTTKNRRERRRHPIPPALVGLLRSLRAGEIDILDAQGRVVPSYGNVSRGPKDPVFPCLPGVDTLRRDLEKAQVASETPHGVLDFHSLRGAFAVLLEGHGVGLSTAQKLMRHSDPALTANVYQSLEFSELAAALGSISDTAERLARVVGKTGRLDGAEGARNTVGAAAPADPTVVISVGTHGDPRSGIEAYEDAPKGRFGASARSKLLAGPTGNRIQRPGCSPGPAVLKTEADTSRH